MNDFNGKVALVTGGARGIGLAVARALMQRGCDIAVFDLPRADGAELAALGSEMGREALLVVGDVAASSDWQAAIAATALLRLWRPARGSSNDPTTSPSS